ncbi:NTP transferase domain-containing protein [Chloroflexi bacterium TSY]|nr:NTP transferase domain-containing protein [Chloroflexi bacterium TSY]
MYVVIIAGGIGTRLWPRSRESNPKQFSDIIGSGQTMIQETVARLGDLVTSEQIYIVTGQQYAELAREQLSQLPSENIIVEPSGRNTGPAIGLACVHLQNKNPDEVVAFLHADQTIIQIEKFQVALRCAVEAAEAGYLATLGIEPKFPHTGFGYIKSTDRIEDLSVSASGVPAARHVERFLEKPDRQTAEAFLAEGGYYWNGGMFICQLRRMINEFKRQQPNIAQKLEQIGQYLNDAGQQEQFETVWADMPSISIDHAIMEGAKRVAVVPLDAGWNDVGSWDALEAVRSLDADQNCVARGETLAVESSGNIVYSHEDEKLIALIGVENLVVVDTGDTLLVGQKSEMQKVKTVVEELKARGRQELL